MEAKTWQETITKTTILNCHNTLEERLSEQAERAFKAGQNEVVEWVETQKLHAGNISIPAGRWQTKKKEWDYDKSAK